MRAREISVIAGTALVFAAVAVLAVLGLGISGGNSERQVARSGLRGVVVLGRCRHGANRLPCSFKPIAANQVIRRYSDDRVVTTFRSNSDGSFRVGLAPGRYILEGSREQRVGGFLRPTYVSVRKDRFSNRRIVYEAP